MLYSHLREIMMRRFTIRFFEQSNKVKLGKIRFVGDIVQVDLFGKMIVNEKLCLNNPLIQINFLILFERHF